jgi:hypothetical protein
MTSCVYFHNVLMCIAWCNQYCSDIDFQIPNWVGYFFKLKFMSQKKIKSKFVDLVDLHNINFHF